MQDGYEPGCTATVATGFEEYTADFSLDMTAALGTATGTINGLAEPEDFATLSFRRIQNCGNGNVVIEVESVNVAEGGSYNFSLPAGDYQLVVSSAGEATQVFNIGIVDSTETVQDINF